MKFSTKKWGSIFFWKKTKPGGGSRGRFGKRPQFSPFFNPSLISEDGYGDDGDGDENGEAMLVFVVFVCCKAS